MNVKFFLPDSEQELMSKDLFKGFAITTLISAVAIYIPLIGLSFAILIPLPALYYRKKLGRRFGALVPAMAILVILTVSGGISTDIFFIIGLLLIGFVLSEFLELKLSVEQTVLSVCCIVFVSFAAVMVFYSNISGTTVSAMISDYVNKNLALSITMYEDMGVPAKNIDMISGAIEKIEYVLVRIIPAIVIVSTLFVTWTSILLARPVFKAGNLVCPDFGRLNHWKAPEYLVWVVITCGVMLALPDKTIKIFGLNGLLVLITIYFFEGIAIVSFYFEKKKMPRTLKAILYTLIAIQQIAVLIVIGLGFFDTWFDFRKLEVDTGKT